MRIISTFKDYYDCIQRNGVDADLIYVRTPTEEDYKGIFYNGYYRRRSYKEDRWEVFRSGYIGFAGEIYPYVGMSYYEYDFNKKRNFYLPHRFIYNRNEYYNLLKEPSKTKYGEKQDIFNTDHSDKLKNIFDSKTPIFHIYRIHGHTTIEKNSELNSVNFEKVIDPYQAYQKLRMYMANQAEPRKEIPVLSDEDAASIHGFNKYSFRMDKKTKPNRKRKGR